jgi:hypothetical protein
MIDNGINSLVCWIFLKPKMLPEDEFARQLLKFENEMPVWKKALEENAN